MTVDTALGSMHSYCRAEAARPECHTERAPLSDAERYHQRLETALATGAVAEYPAVTLTLDELVRGFKAWRAEVRDARADRARQRYETTTTARASLARSMGGAAAIAAGRAVRFAL